MAVTLWKAEYHLQHLHRTVTDRSFGTKRWQAEGLCNSDHWLDSFAQCLSYMHAILGELKSSALYVNRTAPRTKEDDRETTARG